MLSLPVSFLSLSDVPREEVSAGRGRRLCALGRLASGTALSRSVSLFGYSVESLCHLRKITVDSPVAILP